jgi:predicted permease
MTTPRTWPILAEWVRSARWPPSLEGWWQDIRVAARALRRTRTFTLVTLVTLALGIGANTAVFTVVNGVLLRPLPYPAATNLVHLWETRPLASGAGPGVRPQRSQRVTAAEIVALRPALRTLTHLSFTAGPSLMTVTGGGPARRMQGQLVAPGYFDTLGIGAHVGRTFGAAEEAPGAAAVVILSHEAWMTHFNGRPDIVGQPVTLASVLTPNPAATMKSYTIVGVMPEGFDAASRQTEFWLPAEWNPKAGGTFIARLAPGTALAAAATELGNALRPLRGSTETTRYELEPALGSVVATVRPALLMLMGASCFVLLIACANVGNLVLTRMNERRREIAVRTALGAGRGRLVRQLAAETMLLSLASGIGGVLIAYMALRGLRVLATTMTRLDLGSDPGLPRLAEVSLDVSVLLFVAAASLVAGALVGVLPAISCARLRPVIDDLRTSASTSHTGFHLLRRRRSRTALVLLEVALATVLLIGGGLMIHSFARLSSVNLGFDPGHVTTFQVALPVERYPLARLKTFSDSVVDGLQHVPGVVAAGHGQPPMVMLVDRFGLRRRPDDKRPAREGAPVVRLTSAGYLRALGIPITRGRDVTGRDHEHSGRVVLINETLARREFPGEDPIGARVFFGPDDKPWEIVGVTGDVRLYGLEQAPSSQLFALPSQWPGDNVFPLGPYFVVRTEGARDDVLRQVRQIASAIEPEAGVFNVATMDHIVSNRMSRPRLYATLLGSFAGLAAVLAFVGVYGVMAYVVGQRTREIGIRMALGAAPSHLLRMVLTQSLSVAVAGIAIGLAAAVALSRSLQGLLFGVEPLDVRTYAVVTASFVLVVVLAAWLPSSRATRITPAAALRTE